MSDVFLLREVSASNFRCFDALTVPVDPEVTVVVADNGGGKSALLDVISTSLQTSGELKSGSIRDADARAHRALWAYDEAHFPAEVKVLTDLDGEALVSRTSLTAPDRRRRGNLSRRSRIATEAPEVADQMARPLIAHYGTDRTTARVRWDSKSAPKLGVPSRSYAYDGPLGALTDYAQMREWLAQTPRESSAGRSD